MHDDCGDERGHNREASRANDRADERGHNREASRANDRAGERGHNRKASRANDRAGERGQAREAAGAKNREEARARYTIRDARDARDAADCLAIYAPYVRDTAVSFEERIPTEAEFERRIRETAATHPWLVLEDAGRLVGYAYGAPHRARAAYRWAADVTVYVAPSHHRRGVGRALYAELIGRLRDQGLRIACAGVTLPNAASIGLHRACGFEPVGVYRRIGCKHGAWHDVSWWQLELAPQAGLPEEPRGPSGPQAARAAGAEP